MIKNILITGGAGFVGSNLAIKLKKEFPELNIICFDNLKRRGSELNLKRLKEEGINFIHGDIRNEHDFDEIKGFDLMIECSAESSVMSGVDSSPKYLLDTNLVGTINCLELARKNNAKIIFLSTSRVYPIGEINKLEYKEKPSRFDLITRNNFASREGIKENFPLNTNKSRSLYGYTKLASEMLIHEYNEYYNLDFIINRCGVITGPWQMGKVDQGVFVLWMLYHYFKKELSYIGFEGKGKQVRDFLHIDDLYNLIKIQINDFEKFNKEMFNIGGGLKNSCSLLELTSVCEKITGNKINIKSISETRKGDLKWFIMDSSKIYDICDWKPKNDINRTMIDIYEWIKENENQLKILIS